ncbi:ABC transporter ATP-binding protein [Homoserinimonas sp. OAct 916]|uniref:oligopeptide/dipeptide ABC transporter ATP-binding protein n=1 Tax=Homoserinimonas sp. OAct 916 TaxID=2211450 RepID=UPI000DBE44BF|nr:ABC transporter ATP-binding protein [Homoserinimonas sp. OAct 916]
MLEAKEVVIRYGAVTAVAGVDLLVPNGPFGVGLVGESGSGKTTLARAILALQPITSGRILLDGTDVSHLRGTALRDFRRTIQIVMQDADGSLSPRMRVGEAIAEVLRAHNIVPAAERKDEVVRLLREVGLDAEHGHRLPHQLSGGQRQRVSIARALAVRPRVMVFDEPTSALDVTVQAKILDLVDTLREERQLAYLLISHNLAVVERLCEQVYVLYLGRVVESGPTDQVLARPAHPYSAALRSAVLQIEVADDGSASPPATVLGDVPRGQGRERIVLPGIPADPANPPPGCVFHPRCPIAIEICRTVVPERREIEPGRFVECHRAEEMLAQSVDLSTPLTIEPLGMQPTVSSAGQSVEPFVPEE